MTRPLTTLALSLAFSLLGASLLSAQAIRSAQPVPSRSPQATAGRGPLPDPVLFDGSTHPPEKRPDQGMLAEFELPGSEKPSERVGGPAGESPGGSAEQQAAGAAGRTPVQNDPNAKAEGVSVADLKVPEGAEPLAQDAVPSSPDKPQDVSIGDATMQIETAATQQNTVGSQQQQQGSNAQQYEKGAAQGNQRGDNTNRGVERGQTVPSGL